jgi:hypothetical protein
MVSWIEKLDHGERAQREPTEPPVSHGFDFDSDVDQPVQYGSYIQSSESFTPIGFIQALKAHVLYMRTGLLPPCQGQKYLRVRASLLDESCVDRTLSGMA